MTSFYHSIYFLKKLLPATLAAQIVFTLLLPVCSSGAQKKWIGGNGHWDDATSWLPAAVPDSTDQVLFDNSLQPGNYTVQLPDHAVTVNVLEIAPSGGSTIELVLPASNTSSPAFVATSGGNGIVLKAGSIFRNASGLTSGQSLMIRGMLSIENGGTYIHNSRSGHAADIVAKLSVAPGTETGRFQFDVPGGSYPVSLSNRVYGSLVFSSQASGGTQTYNASGTNPLQVRGDLQLQDGVILNIDFTREISVLGSFREGVAVFNLASQPNNNIVAVSGDVWLAAGGLITETSTGAPVFEFRGSVQQKAKVEGSLLNQVILRINNPAGVVLQHPLSVPFELDLQQGNLITSQSALLVIPHNSRIIRASAASFVHGPLKKQGDEAFLYPVGKQRDYAPLAITAGSSATEELTAEYFLGNPQTLYGQAIDAGSMVRVSALEYWKLDQTAGQSVRKVTLSVTAYSHATALDKLLVSRWDEALSSWSSAGNTAYTGIATGQVTSSPVSRFGVFTLASTLAEQNPLPVHLSGLSLACDVAGCHIGWQVSPGFTGAFQVEQSGNGSGFTPLVSIAATPGEQRYAYRFQPFRPAGFYRVISLFANGSTDTSRILPAGAADCAASVKAVKRAGGEIVLVLNSAMRSAMQLEIFSPAGSLLYRGKHVLEEGTNSIRCPSLAAGGNTIIVRITDGHGNSKASRYLLP